LIAGSFTGFKPPDEDGYSLIFSTPGAFRGMSGGPVIDDENRVIGIFGKEATTPIEGRSGLYLGVPISVFIDSPYSQYIQANQYFNPSRREDGVIYPIEGLPPVISEPNRVIVPRNGEPPCISD
ncbi:MAG: hypothetical protein AAF193_08495, partial [Bacteroidota bacterium]